MELQCQKCGMLTELTDTRVPIGRSYLLCPSCGARVSIFKGVIAGATVQNLLGVRFIDDSQDLHDRFCEPGEQWRVVQVVQPCPEKGKGRPCELENLGRCPNQRLYVRLPRETVIYRTCLYRKGRQIFGRDYRLPVGRSTPVTTGSSPPG